MTHKVKVTHLEGDPQTKQHAVRRQAARPRTRPAARERPAGHVVHDVHVAVLLKRLIGPQHQRRVDVDRSQDELGVLAKGFHFADVVIVYVTR